MQQQKNSFSVNNKHTQQHQDIVNYEQNVIQHSNRRSTTRNRSKYLPQQPGVSEFHYTPKQPTPNFSIAHFPNHQSVADLAGAFNGTKINTGPLPSQTLKKLSTKNNGKQSRASTVSGQRVIRLLYCRLRRGGPGSLSRRTK